MQELRSNPTIEDIQGLRSDPTIHESLKIMVQDMSLISEP